jgi:hypothetical protein
VTIKIFYDYRPTQACPFVATAWVRDNKVEEFSSLSFEKAESDLLARIKSLTFSGEVPEPKEVEI